MSAERDDLVRAALAELHEEFGAKLPGRIAALTTALRALRAARGDRAIREEARSTAHKLRGSAGSYGFPEVSAAAGRIEVALSDEDDGPPLDAEPAWVAIDAAIAELEQAARAG